MAAEQRLRLTFAKETPIQYISHLDLYLAWERALRRSGLALSYSQGFHPQARLQLAAALPVGQTGQAELVDVFLDECTEPQAFTERVAPMLPNGLSLIDVREVDLKTKSLQSILRQAEYRIEVEAGRPEADLQAVVAGFLAADRFEHVRMRKQRPETLDLRPLVAELRLESVKQGQAVFWALVSAGSQGNLRPDTLLDALGLGQAYARIQRTRLVFEFDTKGV